VAPAADLASRATATGDRPSTLSRADGAAEPCPALLTAKARAVAAASPVTRPSPPGPALFSNNACASAHAIATVSRPQKHRSGTASATSHSQSPGWQSPPLAEHACPHSLSTSHRLEHSPQGDAGAWQALLQWWRPQGRARPHGAGQAQRRGAEHGCEREECPPTQGTATGTAQGGQGSGWWHVRSQGWLQRGRGCPQSATHGGQGPAWQRWSRAGWRHGALRRHISGQNGVSAVSDPHGTVTTVAPHAQLSRSLAGQRGHLPGWQRPLQTCTPHARRRPHCSWQSRHSPSPPGQQRRPHLCRPQEASRAHRVAHRNSALPGGLSACLAPQRQ